MPPPRGCDQVSPISPINTLNTLILVSFPALPELVEDRVNGRVFRDSEELAVIIRDWFMDWPRAQSEHTEYRENIDRFRALDWATNWDKEALPVFRHRRVRPGSGLACVLFFACLFIVFSSYIPTVV